jgi:hypothetical protein
MRKNSAGYPQDLVNVRPAGELELLDRSGEDWVVGIPVEISLNEQGWDHFSRMMRAALEAVATRQWTWTEFESLLGVNLGASRHDHHRPHNTPWFIRRSGDTPWLRFDANGRSIGSARMLGDFLEPRYHTDPYGACRDLLLQKKIIFMLHETSQWTSEVASFEVPAAAVEALIALDPRLVMSLSLKDSNGNTICRRFADLSVAPTIVHGSRTAWPDANVAPQLDKWDNPHATWTLTSKSAGALRQGRTRFSSLNSLIENGHGFYPGADWSVGVLTVMPGFIVPGTGREDSTYTQRFNVRFAMQVPPDTLEKVAEVDVQIDA